MSTPEDTASLIKAIHEDRLAGLDHVNAQAVCEAIGRRVATEVDDAMAALTRSGLAVRLMGDPSAPAQRHSATIGVPDGATAVRSAKILADQGFRPWEPLDGPAGTIHRRFRRSLTLARTTDLTMVMSLEWPPARGRFGGLTARLPEPLIPNENDFDLVTLPATLWPLYFLIRPARLAVERIGGRDSGGHSLGPFLSTPTDLIEPLLDLVGVGPDDVLVDLGCGTGRVLREAVERRGCRAVGVESNPALVAEAQRATEADGLGDRIEIVQSDAAGSDLPRAALAGTVFFVFVPAAAACELVTGLLTKVAPGTRILAHEQHPLPAPPPGAASVPLLAGQGVTVAHHWRA